MVNEERCVLFLIDNPCTPDCELCEKRTGVCLRQQMRFEPDDCDPPCDDGTQCIDGQCTWTNIGGNWELENDEHVCYPPCPAGTQCVNQRCEPNLTPHCPVTCRPGQACVDGRCGCSKGESCESIFIHLSMCL